MITVVYNDALKREYQMLFDTCIIRGDKIASVDATLFKIKANMPRYKTVADAVGCPWFLVGVMHMMECNLDFNLHLYNGDPLSAKTVHTPAGRPPGNPPWTWEQSAIDDVKNVLQFDLWSDWSIPGMLWKLESNNGLGYRQYHPQCLTPYLWSYTNHYTAGKYVADGHFNPVYVSNQLGAAALIKRAC